MIVVDFGNDEADWALIQLIQMINLKSVPIIVCVPRLIGTMRTFVLSFTRVNLCVHADSHFFEVDFLVILANGLLI